MSEPITTLAILGPLGWPEILVILGLFILLFGAKKLPELARGVGKSIKEFKKATSNIEDDFKSAMDEEANKPQQPQNRSIPNPQPEAEKEKEKAN